VGRGDIPPPTTAGGADRATARGDIRIRIENRPGRARSSERKRIRLRPLHSRCEQQFRSEPRIQAGSRRLGLWPSRYAVAGFDRCWPQPFRRERAGGGDGRSTPVTGPAPSRPAQGSLGPGAEVSFGALCAPLYLVCYHQSDFGGTRTHTG
jgi:hypothetical protein